LLDQVILGVYNEALIVRKDNLHLTLSGRLQVEEENGTEIPSCPINHADRPAVFDHAAVLPTDGAARESRRTQLNREHESLVLAGRKPAQLGMQDGLKMESQML
jgi:hypothetical protein